MHLEKFKVNTRTLPLVEGEDDGPHKLVIVVTDEWDELWEHVILSGYSRKVCKMAIRSLDLFGVNRTKSFISEVYCDDYHKRNDACISMFQKKLRL